MLRKFDFLSILTRMTCTLQDEQSTFMISYTILLKIRHFRQNYRENGRKFSCSITLFQKLCNLWHIVEKQSKRDRSPMTIQQCTCTLHAGLVRLHTQTQNFQQDKMGKFTPLTKAAPLVSLKQHTLRSQNFFHWWLSDCASHSFCVSPTTWHCFVKYVVIFVYFSERTFNNFLFVFAYSNFINTLHEGREDRHDECSGHF